eukprot:3926180-Pyramimonas_sp.AAC.1
MGCSCPCSRLPHNDCLRPSAIQIRLSAACQSRLKIRCESAPSSTPQLAQIGLSAALVLNSRA